MHAIANLKSLLAEGGTILVTFPVGYNYYLDKLLARGVMPFTRQYYLLRVSKDNQWREVEWKDIQSAKYGRPFPRANALVISIIQK